MAEETKAEPKVDLLKTPDTVPNTLDHRLIYEALQNSPVLLRYLQTVLYNNAIALLNSELPKTTSDLEYLMTHAKTKGICQLADALIQIHIEGHELYATAKP